MLPRELGGRLLLGFLTFLQAQIRGSYGFWSLELREEGAALAVAFKSNPRRGDTATIFISLLKSNSISSVPTASWSLQRPRQEREQAPDKPGAWDITKYLGKLLSSHI